MPALVVSDVIDADRVDPDQPRSLVDEPAGARFGQVRRVAA